MASFPQASPQHPVHTSILPQTRHMLRIGILFLNDCYLCKELEIPPDLRP
jgi:hypothetical protein